MQITIPDAIAETLRPLSIVRILRNSQSHLEALLALPDQCPHLTEERENNWQELEAIMEALEAVASAVRATPRTTPAPPWRRITSPSHNL